MSLSAEHMDLLERHLDGALTPQERAAFERLVSEDAGVRAELELQRRVDRSLERLFARETAGESAAVPKRGGGGRAAGDRHGGVWWRAAAAAAVMAAGVWGATAAWDRLSRTPLERVYARTVAAGFVPEVVCTTDEEFAAWTHRNFGHALSLADRPEGLELVGWSYARTLSTYTGVLLARVQGEEVLVVMDFLKKDAAQPEPRDDGMRVFRRELGGLVLYEVTPRERAAIVDRLVQVEPPQSPEG